jgi:small conductance mechanosensitive channel
MRLSAILVASFLLLSQAPGPWLASAVAQEPPAESSSGALAELAAASKALDARRAKIALFAQRAQASQGQVLQVLQHRLDRAWTDLFEGALDFAAQVVEQEAAGVDIARYRARAVRDLSALPGETRAALERLEARVALSTEVQSAIEQAAADANVAAALPEIDRLYAALLRNLELSPQLGIDVSSEQAWLEQRVAERAENVSIYLDLTLQDVESLGVQAELLPAESELAGKLAVAQRRVKMIASALETQIARMEKLELDPSAYKQQIISTTGEITTIDRRVLGGLVDRWGTTASQSITEGGPRLFLQIALFLLIVLAFLKFAQLGQRVVGRGLASSKVRLSELLTRMVISTTRNLIIVVGLLIALSQLGVSLGPLLAGLGIAGFVVGFALQDTLSNFASGMMILIYRPFDVGDLIEAGTVFGKVDHMSLVNTTILTLDNQTLVVPNNKIWGDVIKNVTAQNVRRVDLVFGVSYGDDIPKVEAILEAILAQDERVLDDPEPMVKLHELGDSSVNFVVRPWVATDDYWDVWWDTTRAVKMRFDEEGITIPFPQTDVHFHAAAPPTDPRA